MLSSVEVNQVDDNGLKQGKWSGFYKNGAKDFEGTFKDGEPIGTFNFYYETGELKSKTIYGEEDGLAEVIVYYREGTKMGEGLYKNKKKSGLWKFYTPIGDLKSMSYYVEGVIDSVEKTYHPKNLLAEEKNWELGKQVGKSIRYYKNGMKQSEDNYVDGKLEGKSIDYYPNGAFLAIGKYRDGVKIGTWVNYNEDKTMYSKEIYQNGKLIETIKMNGVFEEYYPSDILSKVLHYENGLKEGRFTEFYDVGEWKIKIKPADEALLAAGAKDEYVRYFDGRKIKAEGYYRSDKLHGEVIHYSLDGKIDKKVTYHMGEVENKK